MLLKNAKLILPDKILNGADLKIENGKIADYGALEESPNEEVVSLGGRYVSAGLIDVHTHGGYGSDFMDADEKAFDDVLRFHIDNGVTTVIATTVTAPIESVVGFLEFYRRYKSKKDLAKPGGVHLEGPFLSLKNKGAQKEEYLLSPEKDDYSFIAEYADVIKTVTIAPELPGAAEMTKALVGLGIKVCGGHDDGIYPEFLPAIENGLSHLTHIYCAMSELRFKGGVRNVGLREYGLIDDRLSCEIIADDKHVPPEFAKMILKIKTADKTCVISDSLRCAGMPPDGRLYRLGTKNDTTGQLFKVSDGVAVLADGTRYAGSVTPVSRMVLNLIRAGISIPEAFRTATLTPAKIIGFDGDIGSIERGKTADICVFDENFGLCAVIRDGEFVRKKF